MKSFHEYLGEHFLNEAVADHARALMATGNYDPAVRGSATKFKADLKKTGATSSEMTAQVAWSNHKHLHPKPATLACRGLPGSGMLPQTWGAGVVTTWH